MSDCKCLFDVIKSRRLIYMQSFPDLGKTMDGVIFEVQHLIYNFGFRSSAASYAQVFPVFCVHCSSNPNSGYETDVVSFWLTFCRSLCRSPRGVRENCIVRGKGGSEPKYASRSGAERVMVSTCKSLCG